MTQLKLTHESLRQLLGASPTSVPAQKYLRALVALGLAALIAYGMAAGLTWEEWQVIGWAVILGGGGLAMTTSHYDDQMESIAAGAPAATFLAGYTIFYWKLPVWQLIDVAAIGCFLLVAYMNAIKKSEVRF
jgi:hypothetical protein